MWWQSSLGRKAWTLSLRRRGSLELREGGSKKGCQRKVERRWRSQRRDVWAAVAALFAPGPTRPSVTYHLGPETRGATYPDEAAQRDGGEPRRQECDNGIFGRTPARTHPRPDAPPRTHMRKPARRRAQRTTARSEGAQPQGSRISSPNPRPAPRPTPRRCGRVVRYGEGEAARPLACPPGCGCRRPASQEPLRERRPHCFLGAAQARAAQAR